MTLPLRSGRVSSSSKLLDLLGQLGVVGDAGEAALPRRRVLRSCPTAALQRLDQVLVQVGDLGGVELLEPAEADHPRGHPVGEHHDVAPGRLAVGELVAHHPEELGVVVDVVDVVDLDAGPRLEVLERVLVAPSRPRRGRGASWRRAASWLEADSPSRSTSPGPALAAGVPKSGSTRGAADPERRRDPRPLSTRAHADAAPGRLDPASPTTRTPLVSGSPRHAEPRSDKGFSGRKRQCHEILSTSRRNATIYCISSATIACHAQLLNHHDDSHDREVAGGTTRHPLLDDVSKAIIEQLQQDGRRSYAAIGKAVGLSEAAVRQRVQRLSEGGVMQVVAVTDPLELGFARQAMIGIRVDGDLEPVADALVGPRGGRLRGDHRRHATTCSSRWSARATRSCSSSSPVRSAPCPACARTETFMYLQLASRPTRGACAERA